MHLSKGERHYSCILLPFLLSERLHIDISGVKRQFLAASWAFAVETLNDFIRRSELNAFVENCAAF
jgi:hypothetical protein